MIMVSAQRITAAVKTLLDTVNLCVVKVVIILILKASKIVIIVTGTVSITSFRLNSEIFKNFILISF